MKKTFQALYAGLFFALLCLPMALSPFFSNDAALEKRELAAFPAYVEADGLNLDFSDQFEAWVSDHLPLRARLLTVANRISGELLGAQCANVLVGRDGWLFYSAEAADALNTNALTDRQLRSIAVTLSLIQEAVTARGGRFTFAPAPNKSTVYPEQMPTRFRQAPENNLTRLTAELETLGVNFTDLRRVLLEQKTSGADGDVPLYHRRDSHWNNRGALLGCGAILDSLGRDHETWADAPYTLENNWRGDLDKLLLPAEGVMDLQVVYQIAHARFRFTYPQGVRDQQAQLESFMSDREDRDDLFTVQNLDRKDGSSLYMVRDSFARALLPYLIDCYETATFKRTDCPNVASIPAGTDLIYEIAERNLSRIIGKAPFLYAPTRTGVSVHGRAEGGSLPGRFEDAGYAYRLYGPLPEDLPAGDCRVYLRLEGEGEPLTLEAFPIYERELLGEGGTNGYSAYLSKDLGLSGVYTVTVITENTVFHCGDFAAD